MSYSVIQKSVFFSIRNNVSTNLLHRRYTSRLLPLSNSTVFKYKCLTEHDSRFVSHTRLLHTTVTQYEQVASENAKQCQDPSSAIRMNRMSLRRRPPATKDERNVWTVKAISTAEVYDLEKLKEGLFIQQLYEPRDVSVSSSSVPDVIHAVAKYEVEGEPREIFFFRDGVIVFWNVHDLECANILQFIKAYEHNPHVIDLIKAESEVMSYTYAPQGKSGGLKGDMFVLGTDSTNLEKYTFSNAMVLSVKLGISEANLQCYIDSIEFVTQDLRAGKKLKLTQQDVLKKQGELFSLRHDINLSSDLLDTPDCYWERDDLENLYHRTCNYFNLAKRTRVINEKLNHCVELVGLLSTHLSDRHHVRLEWMIIVLIMVEVAFETLHYAERFLS